MLNDLLTPNLSLVFCGTAAGTTSAKRGQYYAGKGNKFWRTLFETGLTLRQLDPSEYQLLLTFGIGLTDIVKGQSGMDNAIDFRRASRESFWEKILRCRPGILCFNGKKAAQAFLGGKSPNFSLQPVAIGITRLFVAPSTSGAASGYWDISIWQDLSDLLELQNSRSHRRTGEEL